MMGDDQVSTTSLRFFHDGLGRVDSHINFAHRVCEVSHNQAGMIPAFRISQWVKLFQFLYDVSE